MEDEGAALRGAVGRWRERGRDRERVGEGVAMNPASAYEAVTRQMVEALAADLAEIKGRLNGLLWMLAGTMALDVALRMTGAGS